MLEETLEVGPFTPQELEETCERLKSQGVHFEILKDEEKEKAEMKNDYANLVKKAEYRLETYLGQVFYLRLKHVDFDRNKELFAEYGMATTHEENPPELQAENLSQVAADSKEQKRLQRITARALVILLVSMILFGIGKWIQSLIFDLHP